MDYIQSLREYIGHNPIQMVGAAILLMDNENRLLLLKRTDNGCWGPPGGAVELGEEVESAARRETLEEAGLEVGPMDLFGVFFFFSVRSFTKLRRKAPCFSSGDIRG